MAEPKYKIIADSLRTQIQDGTYSEGDLIPKEMELAAQYQVSRPTVRQAVAQLVNEGLLEKKRHLGTSVRQTKIPQEFTHVIESYDQEMHAKGLATSTQVISFTTEQAAGDVASHLELEPGEPVYKLVRLRYAGKEPVVLVTTYLPSHELSGFEQIDFTTSSLYSELNDFGYPVTHVHRKLEVIAADETISALLSVSTGSPLFYFQTEGSTPDGKMVEYSRAKYRGDLNYFVFDLDKNANDNELRL